MANWFKLLRDDQAFSFWSLTHILFGSLFFIILYKYFKMDPITISILLIIIHTIYEFKDYYIQYVIYDNNYDKIKAGHNSLYSNNKILRYLNKIGIGLSFHLPPNSFINSIGDTIFFIIGIIIAYFYKDNISKSMLNISIWISFIYWLIVFLTYIYIVQIGLHDKKYINNLIK